MAKILKVTVAELRRSAGADWIVNERTIEVAKQVASQATALGGRGSSNGATANVMLPVAHPKDSKKSANVNFEIEVFEDSYTNELVVNAQFISNGDAHPLLLQHDKPLTNAAEILDVVVKAFQWILGFDKSTRG